MNVDGEPYVGPFAFIRNRKVPIMNANGGDWLSIKVDISNAQLRSNAPITLIPAPGANKIIQLQHIGFVLRVPTGQGLVGVVTVAINMGGVSQVATATIAGALDDTVGRYIASSTVNASTVTLSSVINQPLTWALSAGLTGNANNDNTVSLYLTYNVIEI